MLKTVLIFVIGMLGGTLISYVIWTKRWETDQLVTLSAVPPGVRIRYNGKDALEVEPETLKDGVYSFWFNCKNGGIRPTKP